MSSLSNIEEHLHLQEQPVEKRRVDNSEGEPENAKQNEVNLPKTMEADENKELETTTTTMADLPLSAVRHRKLPAELNCQIFHCLNVSTRRKFICGLGWGFYAISRQILLIKTKRICNPLGNSWKQAKRNARISPNNGRASLGTPNWPSVFAGKAFPISGQLCRIDNFPGTICYYYEVKLLAEYIWHEIGLSDGAFPDDRPIGEYPNCYSISFDYFVCHLTGERHEFELPLGAIQPRLKRYGNVFGCGLLLDPNDKLSIFFTLNGKLKGRQTPISPSVGHLFPTVTMNYHKLRLRFTDSLLCILHATIETNFGDNPVKPFEYDIKNCPGMGLEWI